MSIEQTISKSESAPAPGAAWAERQLTPAEREAIRAHYPTRKGPDLAYLGRAIAFVVAFTAVCYFVLRAPLAIPPGRGTCLAFVAVGLLVVAFSDPSRLRRAFRSRRAHVPSRVWVWPVVVTRWTGRNRQGEVGHEIRCGLDGQTKAVSVTPEEWEWFREGPAKAEILPGGRRRVYRFVYEDETVQVYPHVRRLSAGEDAALAELAAPEPPPRSDPGSSAEQVRRKRHRRGRGGRMPLRVRKQDLIWLAAALIIGTSLTIVALESQYHSMPSTGESAGR